MSTFSCDNTTAIACIRKFGSSKDFLRDTIRKKVFHIAKVNNFEIQISYVKSAENKSDKCSRMFKNKSIHTEWTLHKKDFAKCMTYARVIPDIDLFASSANKQLHKFVSWGPCPDSFHVDAFTLNWKELNGFIFAPFYCVSSVLKKCVANKDMVALADETVRRDLQSTQRGRKSSMSSLGQSNPSSDGDSSDPDFRQFVYQLLLHRKIPKAQAEHISQNAWRQNTCKEKKYTLRKWLRFMKEAKIDPYDLSFDRILAFLEFIRNSLDSPFAMIKKGRVFASIVRKLIGDPLTPANNFILEKIVSASFNVQPPQDSETAFHLGRKYPFRPLCQNGAKF